MSLIICNLFCSPVSGARPAPQTKVSSAAPAQESTATATMTSTGTPSEPAVYLALTPTLDPKPSPKSKPGLSGTSSTKTYLASPCTSPCIVSAAWSSTHGGMMVPYLKMVWVFTLLALLWPTRSTSNLYPTSHPTLLEIRLLSWTTELREHLKTMLIWSECLYLIPLSCLASRTLCWVLICLLGISNRCVMRLGKA